MKLNSNGKTLTIFIILVIVLLISSTSIGFFLYNKELQAHHQAVVDLERSQAAENKLQTELKDVKRQLVLAEDKAKEADDKINNLMDEAELNNGLRKELKAENATVKDALEAAKKDKEKAKSDFDTAQKKYKEVLELFKAEQDKSNNLQTRIKELEDAKSQAESKIDQMKSDLKPYNERSASAQVDSEGVPPSGKSAQGKMDLDKIVVNPNDGTRGRVLSVDKEAEFVICSLGVKHGVKSGDVLSVYRGEEYLGDVRVSRVQEELSAADMIPPFSSRKVRKNDSVVFKP